MCSKNRQGDCSLIQIQTEASCLKPNSFYSPLISLQNCFPLSFKLCSIRANLANPCLQEQSVCAGVDPLKTQKPNGLQDSGQNLGPTEGSRRFARNFSGASILPQFFTSSSVAHLEAQKHHCEFPEVQSPAFAGASVAITWLHFQTQREEAEKWSHILPLKACSFYVIYGWCLIPGKRGKKPQTSVFFFTPFLSFSWKNPLPLEGGIKRLC